MDRQTTAFYDDYAEQLRVRPEAGRSAMMGLVERCLRAGDAVLDVGAGGGRDMAAMQAWGLRVCGVEPNARMRAYAVSMHPSLDGLIINGGLPLLGQPFQDLHPAGFDAVVCSAVLMHVPPQAAAESLQAMVAVLKPGGSLLISVPERSNDRICEQRDADGRLFYNHAPSILLDDLQTLGLDLSAHDVSDAVKASTGTRWHSLALTRRG